MGLFDFLGGSKDEESSSGAAPVSSESHYYDPLQAQKTAVATPLSTFLASKVGTGIGEYPTDPNYTNRYTEFMAMNPSDYYDTNIAKPAYEQFTKYAIPTIREGYAGSLRGSGRYGAEEAGYVGLAEQLANTKATFVPQFAGQQLAAGQTEFARQYQNWYQGLAENNPVLTQAINFINSGKQAGDAYGYDTAPAGQSAGGSFLSQLGGVAGQIDFSKIFSIGSNVMSMFGSGGGGSSQAGVDAYSGATGYRDNGTQITI